VKRADRGDDARRPPLIARLLLSLRVPGAEREYVMGDLDEGHRERRALQGPWRAWAWYWLQVASIVRIRWTAPMVRPDPRRGDALMISLLSDLQFVLRSLRRSPLFSVLVILTLTIGIGATSAIFSVVYSVVLADPPYPHSDRLVMVYERGAGGEKDFLGFLTGDDIRRETTSFSSLAMMSYWTPTVHAGGDVEQLSGVRVSHEYFSTLGARPALGRDFTAEEDQPETRRVVILSDALWRRQFGADAGVVGSTAQISGTDYVIAGVMPADFQDLLSPQAEIWSPLGYNSTLPYACRTCHHLRAIARLRDGVTLAAALQEIDGYMQALRSRYPDEYAMVGAALPTLHTDVSGDVSPSLLGLFAAVLLLLLLACANVASLCLGRTIERQNDMAVRLALGAERGRLIRLVSLEAAVLCLVGGALGVLTAWLGTRLLLDTLQIPPLLAQRVELTPPELGFALLATTLSALIGGTLPALSALRQSAMKGMRVGARTVVGRGSHRLRHAIVIGEVALAVLLLAGSGLQIRSLQRALAVRTGFEPEGVLTMMVALTGSRYAEDGATVAYFRQLVEEAGALPGVERAAVVSQLPLGGNFDAYGLHREDLPSANPEEDPSAQRFAVSPAYLDVMRIPLIRGRVFTDADRRGADPVILLNRTGAARIFGTVDPLGKRMKMGGMDGPWRTIVGIVEDVRHLSLEGEIENQMYLPFDQAGDMSSMTLVSRASGPTSSVAQPLTRLAKSLDSGVAISSVREMNAVISQVVAPRRLALSLVGGFALIALILAVGGLYGVMAAGVAERIREMGLRAALGATRGGLLSMVLRRGLLLTIAGTSVGAAGFLAAGGLVRRFVFGVSPADPLTLFGVAITLGLTGLIATALPAWRAAGVDPMMALRE
jgi:putative ABC transport system permease protein